MVWHPHAYRAALGMLEPAWDLASRGQEKRITSRHALLDDAKLPVIQNRVASDFSQIAAYDCQMMLVIDTSQLANTLRPGDIADTTSECIARVGGIRDHAA